ncbi:MAG TPA: helical backbone metal receptor [Thermoanaerobaculia bacterium]|nr:helical backbone metal receptor [Thermoanaerobaculia bacterium]
MVCALAVLAGAARSGGAPAPRRVVAPSPRRVVALAPNLTEIVFALGAGDRLVGVSEHSDYPPAAAAIPVVGGLTPDLERIVSLRPDLVLATTEGNPASAVDLLGKRGIPVLTTSAPDLDGVLSSIRAIADRLGVSAAGKRLADGLAVRRDAVLRTRRPPGLSAILLIWPAPPQAAGAGTFADDMLRTAGARNAVERPGWPVVSPEYLLATACDAVVYPVEKDTAEVFARAFHDGPLSRVPAVRAGRIVGIGGDRLIRPGPRAFDALEELAAALAKIGAAQRAAGRIGIETPPRASRGEPERVSARVGR